MHSKRTPAYKCFRCGSPESCEHDAEHDWGDPLTYRQHFNLPAMDLFPYRKCDVAFLGRLQESHLVEIPKKEYDLWDGKTDCVEVRRLKKEADRKARMRANAVDRRIDSFLSSHPEGFYWVRHAPSSFDDGVRPAFVVFLDHKIRKFIQGPGLSYPERDLGILVVDILGPCSVPDEVLKKLSVEIVMSS